MKMKTITSDILLQHVSDPGVRWKEHNIAGAQAVGLEILVEGEVIPLWLLFCRKEKDAKKIVTKTLRDLEANLAPKADLSKIILASIDTKKKVTGKFFFAKVGIRKRSFGTIVANGFDLAEDVNAFDLIYAILMTSEGRTESKDKVLKHFDKLITEKLQAQTAKPEAAAW
jgi:hypothetical protein